MLRFFCTALIFFFPGITTAGVDALQCINCNGDICCPSPLGSVVSFGTINRNEILYACCKHQVDAAGNCQMRVHTYGQWRNVSQVYVGQQANSDIAILRVNVVLTRQPNLHHLSRRTRLPQTNSPLDYTSVRTHWRGRLLRAERSESPFFFSEPPIVGDSGGAIVDEQGNLIGVISGYTVDNNEGVASSYVEIYGCLEANYIHQSEEDETQFHVDGPQSYPPVINPPVVNPPRPVEPVRPPIVPLPDAPLPDAPLPHAPPIESEFNPNLWESRYEIIQEQIVELQQTDTGLSQQLAELRTVDIAILQKLESLNQQLASAQLRLTQLTVNVDNWQPTDLTGLLSEIDTLRTQIAEMQEAELLVRFRVGEKVSEDTVTIFDPEDSLNLYIDAEALEQDAVEHSHD